MILEIGQGYKLSPENSTPDSLYTAEYLHKIYGVEKFHEMFGLSSRPGKQ
jgi:hypothetical protein